MNVSKIKEKNNCKNQLSPYTHLIFRITQSVSYYILVPALQ